MFKVVVRARESLTVLALRRAGLSDRDAEGKWLRCAITVGRNGREPPPRERGVASGSPELGCLVDANLCRVDPSTLTVGACGSALC